MLNEFIDLLNTNFMPHGHCYLWSPFILWGHAVSDVIIAISYFSIPIVLIYFIQQRDDIVFSRVFILFAVFILACGVGHLLDVWNIWHGDYTLSSVVRIITALASLATASVLWPLLPKALQIPSTKTLEKQIRAKREALKQLQNIKSELEDRVKDRTRELEEFNNIATGRELEMIKLKQRINELCDKLNLPHEFDLSFLNEVGINYED
ncbi:MAG: hypothetical protein KDD56_02165 [Bdellovibrionales bacterium]|nr:hypothetical protein [Bdellovibrionales bacterium]